MKTTFASKDEAVLALASRRKIYALVKEFSGCHFHELERKSRLAAGTLQYHLHYLTKHELLTLQKDGNKIRYFTAAIPQQHQTLLALLRQKYIRHILLFLLQHDHCTQQELVDFLSLAPSTISLYLSKLAEQGIIHGKKQGKRISYQLAVPAQDIITTLVTYRESFFDTLVDQTIMMWDFR